MVRFINSRSIIAQNSNIHSITTELSLNLLEIIILNTYTQYYFVYTPQCFIWRSKLLSPAPTLFFVNCNSRLKIFDFVNKHYRAVILNNFIFCLNWNCCILNMNTLTNPSFYFYSFNGFIIPYINDFAWWSREVERNLSRPKVKRHNCKLSFQESCFRYIEHLVSI